MRRHAVRRRTLAVVAGLAALCGIVTAAPAATAGWTGAPLAWVQFGGADSDIGRTVVPLPDGGLVAGGFFGSTITFGSTTLTSAGSDDAFITRLDASGDVVWAIGFGGTSSDLVADLAVDASGAITAVGYFGNSLTIGSTTLTSAGSRDGFVARFDANGNAQWALRFGGTAVDSALGVVPAANGDVIVGGFIDNAATFASSVSVPVGAGQGSRDLIVVRLTSAGGIVFLERLGGTGIEGFGGLDIGLSEEVFVGGTFASPTVAIGSSTLVNAGNSDALVTKLGADGVPVWATSCGGAGVDGLVDVTVDGAGGVYLFGEVGGAAACGAGAVGTPQGGADLLVARVDGNGTVTWAQRHGGAFDEAARQLARGPDGGLVLAGATDIAGSGTRDAFLVAVGPDGTLRWTGTMGGSGDDIAQGVAVDAEGYVFVVLRFEGGDLDPGTADLQITTAGLSDVVVVTLTPDGSLAPIVRPRPPVAPAYTG